MKKITFLLLALAMICYSCQDKNAYTIEGSFGENTFDGKTVFLQKMDSMEAQIPVVIDSAIVAEGKFKFEGTITESALAFISVGKIADPEPDSPSGTLILEGGKIKLVFDKKALTVSGTPMNDEFDKIHQAMNKLVSFYEEVSKAGGPQAMPLDANGKDANARLKELQDNLQTESFSFTKANMGNKVGEFLFYSSAGMFTKEQLAELLPLSDSIFRSKPEIKALQEELSRVIPQVGQPVSDVALMDKDGKQVNLSEYVGKGKYVLIDFWASWCGPCIQEMPTLVKVYAAYKAKGLEIVGISVDQEKDAWLGAIKKQNMTWVQLADGTGNASKTYAVNSIPHTILVDPSGVIVAKDLRGSELELKLSELLK